MSIPVFENIDEMFRLLGVTPIPEGTPFHAATKNSELALDKLRRVLACLELCEEHNKHLQALVGGSDE